MRKAENQKEYEISHFLMQLHKLLIRLIPSIHQRSFHSILLWIFLCLCKFKGFVFIDLLRRQSRIPHSGPKFLFQFVHGWSLKLLFPKQNFIRLINAKNRPYSVFLEWFHSKLDSVPFVLKAEFKRVKMHNNDCYRLELYYDRSIPVAHHLPMR